MHGKTRGKMAGLPGPYEVQHQEMPTEIRAVHGGRVFRPVRNTIPHSGPGPPYACLAPPPLVCHQPSAVPQRLSAPGRRCQAAFKTVDWNAST